MNRNEVKTEAYALRRWAEGIGVFSQGRASGTAPQLVRADSATMFSAGAAEAFISKPITAVGFAASPEKEPRVFIYTRRRLNKDEQAQLSDNGLQAKVVFQVAQPFGIATPSTAARFPAMFRRNRLACGSSISVGNDRQAGTLGALLKDSAGDLFGLSCNHVTGGCSNARVAVPIVAPGILDVGAGAPEPRTIGFHERALPFVPGDPSVVTNFGNNTDAAIFKIIDPKKVSSWQGDQFDTPATTEDPQEDALVEKVGRTTRHTTGFVESQLVGPQRIDYNMTVYHSAEENVPFKGTVFFEPIYILRGNAGSFAIEGDSGALVVNRSPGELPQAAIGLVIGGHGNEETYMVPLKPILAQLKMTLVTGH